MVQKVVAIVPARAGSKGFPGKNMQLFEGMPLYLRAALQGVRIAGRALISTDIDDVLQIEPPAGVNLSRRPDELAADTTPMEEVVKYVIEKESLYDFTLVLLQATSPLRRDADIYNALELFNNSDHDLVMSVVQKERGVLKCGTLNNGCFVAVRDPSYCFRNRQQLPEVYAPNGAIYVFSAKAFLDAEGFPVSSIGAVPMALEHSLDIDSKEDYEAAVKVAQGESAG